MNTNDSQATNVSTTAADQGEPGSILVQLVPHSWEDCIDLLLTAHIHGTPAGRAMARANFTHLARVADLSAEVLTHLGTCTGIPDEAWMTKCRELIGHVQALRRNVPPSDLQTYEGDSHSGLTPETTGSDQSGVGAPVTRRGALATAAGRPDLELQVLYSAAGFYLGTWSDEGPFTRESAEYWPRHERAAKALSSGDWTQRIDH